MLALKGKIFLLATTILTVTTVQAAEVRPLKRTDSVENLAARSSKAKLKEILRAESATLQKEKDENVHKIANLKHNIQALREIISEDLNSILVGKNVKKWNWSREDGMHNLKDLEDAALQGSVIGALMDVLDTYPTQVDGTPVPHDPATYMEKTTRMPGMIPTAADKEFKQHTAADEGMVHYLVKLNVEVNNLEALPELLDVISEAEKNLNKKKNEIAKLALKDKEITERINEIAHLMTK